MSPGEEGSSERTMVVDARALMRAPSWRPFRFKKLEKVGRAQAGLAARLPWLAPPGDVVGPVCERLKQVFDAEVRFSIEAVLVRPPGELRSHLSEPGFLALLAPGALPGRAVLDVELALAHAAVDLLLGGAGETVGLRPLTEIEEGVMSFVVLEALKAVAPHLEQGFPRLRLEGVARGAQEVAELLGEEDHLVALHFNAVLGPHAGMVRLVVPASVLEAAVPAEHSPRRKARLRQSIHAHLGRLAAVRTWLRAEIGHVVILRRDLASLRVKDVVLLDELTARPDLGEGGTARLRVGMGRVGRLDAEVFLEDEQFKARITALVRGTQGLPRRVPSESEEAAAAELGRPAGEEHEEDFTDPEAGVPLEAQGGAAVNDVDKPQGSDLLGDVPLQIAVELARVAVTAEQVVSLREGQVLELHRGPGEPVELSVNGKVVARGELVEVEGQLGVRVLSLEG